MNLIYLFCLIYRTDDQALAQSSFLATPFQPNLVMAGGLGLVNSVSTFTLVTGANGQITLLPSTMAPVTSTPLPVVAKPKGKRKGAKAATIKAPKPSSAVAPVVRAKNRPAAILPKPIIIHMDEISSKVDAAVSEALAGCSTENQSGEMAAPAVVVKPTVTKPPKLMKTTRLLAARNSRKPQHHRLQNMPPRLSANPSPAKNFPPALTALCNFAREARQNSQSEESAVTEQETAAVEEEKISTPTTDPVPFVSTPTSTRRRSSHVRQLNFGETPDTPVARSPVRRSIRNVGSEITWDSALRGITTTSASGPGLPGQTHAPEDTTKPSVFATPKGKAKRVRKSSPLFRKETADTVVVEEELISTTSPTKSPQPESEPIASTSEETMFPVPEHISPSCPTLAEKLYPNLMAGSESNDVSDADLVAASILSQMANTPYPEAVSTAPTTAAEPNLPNFSRPFAMHAPSVSALQQAPSMPVLSTPRTT